MPTTKTSSDTIPGFEYYDDDEYDEDYDDYEDEWDEEEEEDDDE